MRFPLERDLGAVSVWPEIRKLYGHNSEMYRTTSTLTAQTAPLTPTAVDANESPVLVASAAKARDARDATIRIWNVAEGKCYQELLNGHKSTVATLAFSPDGGKYLASAGKDRRICLWKNTNGITASTAATELNIPNFVLKAAHDRAHKRIIWSVHFCPFEAKILVSASRDGFVKLWRVVDEEDDQCNLKELYSFQPNFLCTNNKADAVTALSFAPVPVKSCSSSSDDRKTVTAVLALGLESGRIELWSVPFSVLDDNNNRDAIILKAELLQAFPKSLCHIATVTKLAWRPYRPQVQYDSSAAAKKNTVKKLHLASSSMDRGCRVFEVSF